MTEEFNLSQKVFLPFGKNNKGEPWVYAEDVKEFIKRLKEEFRINTRLPKEISEEIINKLAGEQLI